MGWDTRTAIATAGALTLTAVAVLALAPAAGALHGTALPEFDLCGRVVNEAGWALGDVSVTAHGLFLKSLDVVPPASTLTAPDGTFQLSIYSDAYIITLRDTLTREERGGAIYVATGLTQVGAEGTIIGGCGEIRGRELGDVQLLSPITGFLEVTVTDGALPGPLAGATVTSSLAEGLDWGFADTDAAGVARLTCPLASTVEVRVNEDGYEETSIGSIFCDKALVPPTPPVAAALVAFRTPVAVRGQVLDADTGEGIVGADVLAAPRTLAPLAGHPYLFADVTEEEGYYELGLPWGDTFDVAASADGYDDAAGDVAVALDDIGDPPALDLSLARARFPFAGRVEDIHGSGLAASLTFTGPAPLDAEVVVTSAADGTFALTLAHGSYDILIDAAGKNPRECGLSVALDGATTLDREDCLTLLALGTGAARGRLLDGLTSVGVPGADVSAGAASGTTASDGSFALEVPAGTWLFATDEAGYLPSSRSISVALDEVLDLGDLDLTRARLAFTVAVTDSATSAVVAGAEACIELRATDGATLDLACAIADADGLAEIDTPWAERAALGPAFDAGSHLVTGERVDATPLYDLSTCFVSSGFDLDVAPALLPCPLGAVPAVATPVGPLRDAHTDLPIEGAEITATDGVPCDAPYACTATTGAAGTAFLLLPSGRAFDLAADHDAYQAPAPVPDVLPGDAVFVDAALARRPDTLDVTLLDAHTSMPVEGAAVSASLDGGACDPGLGGFACTVSTDADGRAALSVPWGTLAVTAAAGSYTVHLPDADEEGVLMRVADTSVAAPLGADPDAVTLRALRAAGDAITGSVLDFAGAVVPGAVVSAVSERDGFVCDPDEHDSPGDFPDCAPRPAEGAFTLLLPHGTLDGHPWGLDASAAAHFVEHVSGVALGDDVDLTLWPLLFDLVVEPRDAASNAIVPFTTVCVRNLDQVLQSLPAPPSPADELCASTGALGEAVVFQDLVWTRSGPDDVSDLFLVRAVSGPDHLPAAALQDIGPASALVTLPILPLIPSP